MTGSKTLAPANYYCYDLGLTAKSNVKIEGGEYENVYQWAQSHITIEGAKIKTLRSAVLYYNNSTQGSLSIKSGTEIDELIISYSGKYIPQITIETGAKINVLDFTNIKSTDRTKVSIAEGTVTTIKENH